MTQQSQSTEFHRPKILLLGIGAPYNKTKNIESYFAEFLNLVRSNGVVYDEIIFMKIREIDSATFLTKGKLEEVRKICDEKKIEHVIISEPITPMQERNLGDALDCFIFDRTHLILEIFEKAALTSEGKTQVAIAMLNYRKTRLAGKGVFMEQQAGFIGGRGLGETAKERETRHIENQILKLRRDLEKFQQARQTQRKRRLSNRVPHLCLIGYTNAGKSTLLNALTKSNVLAEDKLFATLDTTTRELYIDGTKKGIISDTVGFIQLLPHQLIEAFKSTLSELHYADLLLQIIDIADPNWEDHIKVVYDILEELNIAGKDMLYVFNKIDKVDDVDALSGSLQYYQPHVLIHTQSKEGLQPLVHFLKKWKPMQELVKQISQEAKES
jgi:GTP-binding protein HflX